jgi:Arc/MetJ family transcription regulator
VQTNKKIMATNIDIDQEKLSQIMTMKQFKSKKEAVNEALSEYLKNLLRQEVLTWKGSNCWEGDLDQMRTD